MPTSRLMLEQWRTEFVDRRAKLRQLVLVTRRYCGAFSPKTGLNGFSEGRGNIVAPCRLSARRQIEHAWAVGALLGVRFGCAG